ncbi:MAG TPA: MmcQ/YjbR family DNA-binding protein [Hyphomicrobiaceae bacterium]|nr:MmcQ/YjbR family DNA-binding protein [Hyphomicrobiaceae bacterium]
MASASDLRRIALSLPGTTEAKHVDRIAFNVHRIYATLAPDDLTANLKFTLDEQQLKCLTAPDAFAPVPGGWGRMGFTTVTLARVTTAELRAALELAHAHAVPKKSRRKREP